MTQDNLARELSAREPSDDAIYEALVAALRSNARGRAFLDEYARRSRAADTAAALEALARIEALLTRQRSEALGPENHAIDPDDAYVPFEFDMPPDMIEPREPPAAIEVRPVRQSSADLLAQVMALSPEERIALFS